jgi:hypothetical protein
MRGMPSDHVDGYGQTGLGEKFQHGAEDVVPENSHWFIVHPRGPPPVRFNLRASKAGGVQNSCNLLCTYL